MDQKTLKLWRLVVPCLLFTIFAWPVGKYLPRLNELGPIDTPWFKGSLLAIILGLLYSMTPLRMWANQGYHLKVNRNISSELWEIAKPGVPMDTKWDWARSRRVFYKIVDSDPTLIAKTQNVMANGFLWTTAADLRAISFVSAMSYALLWLTLGEAHGVKAWFIGASACFFVSFLLSDHLTKKHVSLSNEQLEHMSMYHQGDLSQKIDESLSAR